MEDTSFVSDIFPDHLLYAITIRSTVAKGRLVSIEPPSLPDDFLFISAKDIPGKNCLEGTDLPLFAEEKLSYIGEPVALIVGPDKDSLEKYADECLLVVDEERPVFFAPEEKNDAMIAASRDIRIGDPETAFANAASVVKGTYRTGIQEHWYAEPTGAVAWLERRKPDDAYPEEEEPKKGKKGKRVNLVVCTATQWPFHVKRSVAQALGLASPLVHVRPTTTDIHLDGRLWYPSLVACHAALGAWIAKKPVRLMLTRKEDFSFSPKRCQTQIAIANAFDENGVMIGTNVDVAVDVGAYAVNAQELLDHACLGSMGMYKTQNVHISGAALLSNIPPQGAFAGFGLAGGFFAMECQAFRIADACQLDPAQWRKEHCTAAGVLPLGMPFKETVSVEKLINAPINASDYARKWASYELLKNTRKHEEHPAESSENLRGIGVALGYQGNGLLHPGIDKGIYSIELVLEKDGSLEIKTSMVNSGSDYGDLWGGIASAILGMDAEMVRISSKIGCPDSGPATMSRNIAVLTALLKQACLAIRKQRFRDPLPITVKRSIRPAKNALWESCFANSQNAVDASGFARLGRASAVVEVTVDPAGHTPRIRGVWLGINGGRIVSLENARRAVNNAVIQALGWAYEEKINYVKGSIPEKQFENFDILAPSQIPPITIDFIGSNSEEPKGIGDLPFTCVPAAYLQAVSQALNYPFESLPLCANDIWRALAQKRNEEQAT
jgi:CO/xanthine dehydrogenase Mo-binding subunit